METVLSLLKSIDFWTIVGSIGSVAGAVFAVFALIGFNRKSERQMIRDEVMIKANAVEASLSEFRANFTIEWMQWEDYAKRQPPTWKSTEPEFKTYLSKTYDSYTKVAKAMDVLIQEHCISSDLKYQNLRDGLHSLASEVNKKMEFRKNNDVALEAANERFKTARRRL